MKEGSHALDTVPVVPLDEDDLLGNVLALLNSTETDDATGTRVGLLVSMGHTHTTTNGDIEAFELSVGANDGNEPEVVREDVDVIGRRDGDSDLEL
jgi:hypothetical protein